MASPQEDVFAEGSEHHVFLEYVLRPGHDDAERARAIRAARSTASEKTHLVVAFGASAWAGLAGAAPVGLRDFDALNGAGRSAPSTQRDLFFWIQAPSRDLAFQRAYAVHRAVEAVAELALEEAGFVYLDSRDLTGFIDGSANPKGDAARAAALVPKGEPGEAGSFVLTQCWVHDLEQFGALSVSDQERVIGRTKPDSVEFESDAMPADSHVSRTDVKEGGVALKIYRRSVPFGGVAEHGLYFLAFACDLHRFDVLLRRMFGVSGDGVHDRLTDYSQAVTGSYWFAPSQDALDEVLSE